MKKAFSLLVAMFLGGAWPATAGDVGFDLNLHIGNQAPAPIIVDEPPLFLVPESLGFHVAVGVPYDMFHIEGSFYLCKQEMWYVAPSYSGPWQLTRRDRLPPGLAKRRYADVIALRNEEYRYFQQDPAHYKNKSYRPGKANKERTEKGKHKKGHG
jgi:hypothetical protein